MTITNATVNIGTSANDGTGDSIRTAFNNINAALWELSTNSTFTSATISTMSITTTLSIGNVFSGTANGVITIGNGTINSTAFNNGAAIIRGGIGISGNTNIGGTLLVGGAITGTLLGTATNASNIEVTDNLGDSGIRYLTWIGHEFGSGPDIAPGHGFGLTNSARQLSITSTALTFVPLTGILSAASFSCGRDPVDLMEVATKQYVDTNKGITTGKAIAMSIVFGG